MTQDPISAGATVALFDARPFFEKALLFGVQHGIIDRTKLDAIAQEAPKGMVQIARYFGNEFLLPDLQLARQRIVNLVGLHLEDASGGDLRVAASLLRDHSFLSRSKAGADMLKALIVMPENTELYAWRGSFSDDNKKDLAVWSLKSHVEYQNSLAKKQPNLNAIQAAFWFAEHYGMTVDKLCSEAHGFHAEAVVRTGLLMGLTRHKKLPDWPTFEKMITNLRLKKSSVLLLKLPKNFPLAYHETVDRISQSVADDLSKLMKDDIPLSKVFFYVDSSDQIEKPNKEYFWIEDFVSEISYFDNKRSTAWDRLTKCRKDDGTVLTLCLCLATGSEPKILLTEKSAKALVRKIRKKGFTPSIAVDYLLANAPAQHQENFVALWNNFVSEARSTLVSDHDYTLTDAFALMRRECNVKL